MVDFSRPDDLRARFAELANMREGIQAQSAPLREQRDTLAAEAQAATAALDQQIGAIEADLFDINQEAALIARALGGRTGE